MAALIFGLKMFRSYLLGRHFQIRFDNQALTFYQKSKDPTGQCRFFVAPSDCESDGGEPCKQCNKRVNSQHKVSRVQTRAQRSQATCDSDAGGGRRHADRDAA